MIWYCSKIRLSCAIEYICVIPFIQFVSNAVKKLSVFLVYSQFRHNLLINPQFSSDFILI